MGRFEFQGYSFATAKEMDLAKKEEESIAYIRAKLDFKDRDKLRKMYDSFVEKQSFITPIGITFMKEIQNELSMFSVQTIPPVPVTVPWEQKKSNQGKHTSSFLEESEKRKAIKKEMRDAKLRNSRIIIFFLVLVIAAMFGYVIYGNAPAFQDDEQKLQDKYATWQQQLEQREQELNAKEQELNLQMGE